jgi:hypothetical protein
MAAQASVTNVKKHFISTVEADAPHVQQTANTVLKELQDAVNATKASIGKKNHQPVNHAQTTVPSARLSQSVRDAIKAISSTVLDNVKPVLTTAYLQIFLVKVLVLVSNVIQLITGTQTHPPVNPVETIVIAV